MQQRRLRLGDILDDYCPRERRITNHAVVAMIGEEVRQTRCTTCDAEHEYKHARVPPARKKKGDIAPPDVAEGTLRARTSEPELVDDIESVVPEESFEIPEPLELAPEQEPAPEVESEPDSAPPVQEDEGPVHRPLIRATLPRPEGQAPERKPPEFTIRQPGSRGGRDFDGNRNGQRHGRRGARPQGGGGGGQSSRFGGQGPRHGSGHGSRGPGQGQRQQGNRPGANRGGGRPGPGGGQGRGGGRKRGR